MMKAIIEHLIVAMIAIGMAVVGYTAMQHYGNGAQQLISWNATGWTLLICASVVTWTWLYRMCRRLHWLVLPVMGVLSPLIGSALLFVPFTFVPWVIIWEYAPVVFPTGVACGFVVSICTLPFRPKEVLHGNA